MEKLECEIFLKMLKINNNKFSQDFGGGVSFEKAGKLFGGRKTELFRCVVFPSPKPPTFPGNDQRGFPFGNPKLMVFFLLCIFVTSGYLFWLFSYLYKHTPTLSKRTTKGGRPFGIP